MASLTVANPITPITVNTAVLRTVVSAFEQNMVAVCGLVKVFSTGQIDLATYQPTTIASNTVYGWSMFRFNDALQATCPIFLRIQYESSNRDNGAVRLRFQVGTAHNGQGVLQGQFSNELIGNESLPADFITGALTPFHYHGGTGRIALLSTGLAGNVSSPSGRLFSIFGIERTRDNNGNYTNNGFTVVSGSTTQHFVCNPLAEPLPPTETRWHAITSARTGGSRFNNEYPMGVIQPFSGLAVTPLTIFGVGHSTEYALGEVVAITTNNGGTIFYRCQDIWGILTTNFCTSKRTAERILMRWD